MLNLYSIFGTKRPQIPSLVSWGSNRSQIPSSILDGISSLLNCKNIIDGIRGRFDPQDTKHVLPRYQWRVKLTKSGGQVVSLSRLRTYMQRYITYASMRNYMDIDKNVGVGGVTVKYSQGAIGCSNKVRKIFNHPVRVRVLQKLTITVSACKLIIATH